MTAKSRLSQNSSQSPSQGSRRLPMSKSKVKTYIDS